MSWNNLSQISPRSYNCGHCSNRVASQTGYCSGYHDFIYICPCGRPTYFNDTSDLQVPGSIFGKAIDHLPEEVKTLYNEARRCMQVSAFTSAVMGCRKILMHIAVEEGAEENCSFKEYVEYLDGKNFIPPKGKAWVDKIRDKGNEANHEIVIIGKNDAVNVMTFMEMLLKFTYEFPAKVAT